MLIKGIISSIHGVLTKHDRLVFFSIFLFIIPPTGILTGNEEMYYGLAYKSIFDNWNGVFSSYIISVKVTGLFQIFIIGYLVSYFGFGGTQAIGAIFSCFFYSHILHLIFKKFLKLIFLMVLLSFQLLY